MACSGKRSARDCIERCESLNFPSCFRRSGFSFIGPWTAHERQDASIFIPCCPISFQKRKFVRFRRGSASVRRTQRGGDVRASSSDQNGSVARDDVDTPLPRRGHHPETQPPDTTQFAQAGANGGSETPAKTAFQPALAPSLAHTLERRLPQLRSTFLSLFGCITVLFIRFATATVFLGIMVLAWLGYFAANQRLGALVHSAASTSLGRSIKVGRLKRLVLPLGVAAGKLEIAPDASKPCGSLGAVQVRLAIEPRRWITLRTGRVRFDVQFRRVALELHQHQPGEWDLGWSVTPGKRTDDASSDVNTADALPSGQRARSVPTQELPANGAEQALPPALAEATLPVALRVVEFKRSSVALDVLGTGDSAFGRGIYVFRGIHGRLVFAQGMNALTGKLSFETEHRGAGSCELALDLQRNIHRISVQTRALPAKTVVALLNLPFESDTGRVHGQVALVLRPDAKAPELTGTGRLQQVALRLAPDAPSFTGISGRLRFDESMVIFEGPTGFFGQLPITVVGSIDLSKDYNLIGFVRRVAISDVLKTFRVESPIPVHGSVKAEVRMHGPLESPLLTGAAISVGAPWRADRIPLRNARADFQLDTRSMELQIAAMEATLQDGGQLSGHGVLKLAANGAVTASSIRDTGANESSSPVAVNDSRAERDPATQEPSVQLALNLRGAHAGPLLARYLDEPGKQGTVMDSIGRLSAELTVSGPLSEAELNLRWRLVGTAPPEASQTVASCGAEAPTPNAKLYGAASGTLRMPLVARHTNANIDINTGTGARAPAPAPAPVPAPAPPRTAVTGNTSTDPEPQRLRFTLDAYGIDLRRLAWRPEWTTAPKALLDTRLSADVTLQQPKRSTADAAQRQQAPCVEAFLDVRRLQLNEFGYTRRLAGKLRFHPDEGVQFQALPHEHSSAQRSAASTLQPGSDELQKLPVFLSVQLDPSFRRDLAVHLRRDRFRLDVSYQENSRFEACLENMPIEELLGPDYGAGGLVEATLSVDLQQERGTGSFALRDAYFRQFRCRAFAGELFWLDKTVFLQNSVIQQARSEYHIEGVYSSSNVAVGSAASTLPSWQTKIVIPRGDIAELACLAQAVNGQLDPTILSYWEIPPHLSLEEQILWFADYLCQSADVSPDDFLNDDSTLPRRAEPGSSASPAGDASAGAVISADGRRAQRKRPLKPPSLADLRGSYRGTISMSSGAERLAFDLNGEQWAIGPHELGTMCARGGIHRGIINLEQLSFQVASSSGAMVHLSGTADPAGALHANLHLAKVPLHLLSDYGLAPVRLTGVLHSSAELAGTVRDPTLHVKGLWQEASLNGLRLRDPQAELRCDLGRCRVRATAAVPVQQRNWGPVRPSWRFWKRPRPSVAQQRWLDGSETSTAKPGASRAASSDAAAAAAAMTLHGSMPLSGVRLEGSLPIRLAHVLERLLDPRIPLTERFTTFSLHDLLVATDASESMQMDVQVKRSGAALVAAFLPQVPVAGGSADLRIRLRGAPLQPQVTARCSLSDVRIAPPDLETPIESVYGEVELRDWMLHVHSMTGLVQGRVWSLKGVLPVWTPMTNWDASPSDAENVREPEPLTLQLENLPVHLRDRYHGRATGQVTVHGTALQPVLRGSLTLHDGSIMLLPGSSNRNTQRITNANSSSGGSISSSSGGGGVGNSTTTTTSSSSNSSSTSTSNGNGSSNNTTPLRPDNELDMRTYESDESFMNPFLELVEQGFPDIVFEEFRLRLGSRTRVVFPLVLSLHLQGDVDLNGPLSDLRPSGSFRILDGSLNLLTNRLYLIRSVPNSVSFSPDAEQGAPLDPLLHVSLSDRRKYTVRLRNVRASKWESALEVLDAQGVPLERSQLVAMLNERLGNVSANLQLRNGGSLALRSLLNTYTVGGSLGRGGGTLWRLSPNVTARPESTALPGTGLLSEQLGVYGELESGRFVLSFSRDMQGLGITSISYRPWERFKMEYEKRETGEQHLEAKIYLRGASDD